MRKNGFIYLIILPHSSKTVIRQSKAGVGKLWPAGRIRPADAFCPARGVVNSTLASYFPCKNQTWSWSS